MFWIACVTSLIFILALSINRILTAVNIVTAFVSLIFWMLTLKYESNLNFVMAIDELIRSRKLGNQQEPESERVSPRKGKGSSPNGA